MRRFFDKRATVVDITDKEVSTTVAPSKTLVDAAPGPSLISRI
jgi:hypothetical protein